MLSKLISQKLYLLSFDEVAMTLLLSCLIIFPFGDIKRIYTLALTALAEVNILFSLRLFTFELPTKKKLDKLFYRMIQLDISVF